MLSLVFEDAELHTQYLGVTIVGRCWEIHGKDAVEWVVHMSIVVCIGKIGTGEAFRKVETVCDNLYSMLVCCWIIEA